MARFQLAAIVSHFRLTFIARNFSKARLMASSLVPPVAVRGMTVLDRQAFASTVKVPCFKFGAVKLSDVTPSLKKYILKLKNLKPIQSVDDGTVVYLDPKKVRRMSDIDEKDKTVLSDYVKEVEETQLSLGYENWNSDEIFRAVFPEGFEIPTSYSKVGHIVHLNLRDCQLPYKNLIGQVFLDNVPNARTVVNKLNTIDTTYRHFSMEILAGDDDTVATVKENGLIYQFDFARVYWNPRLSTEHAKLLTFMTKGDVLYDVFAGVGPFAVPAARKGVKVLANDLNPESYKWLEKNAIANKAKNLRAFNKDGRDFLKSEVKSDIIERRNAKSTGNEHIAMNLPALASEFLDVLAGWFSEDDVKKVCTNPPTIHLYCFVKTDKSHEDSIELAKNLAKALVEEQIGCPLTPESLRVVHHVRNVSPNKEMMRVSFYLTESMAAMGKSRKTAKTKNVFKVPTKSTDSKTKNSPKSGKIKKTNRDTVAKKSKEKIKKIDQQLQTLRPLVNAKDSANPKPSSKAKKLDKCVALRASPRSSQVEIDLVKNLQIL